MRCREFESLLTEYLDGNLASDERREMDEHLLACPACRAEHEEASFAMLLLREAPPVQPPPQLVADIIHDTIGVGSGSLVPAGGGLWGFLQPILNPFLEPRFVMGMAMTVVSFSMVSYHGQRAFESWRNHDASALIQMAGSAGDAAESAWRRLNEIAETARELYNLQMADDLAEPSGEPR
jgi:hypothetical protein